MSAEQRALAIADKIVPAYRDGGRRYSCTGNVAKMWQAAYDGALTVLTPEPTPARPVPARIYIAARFSRRAEANALGHKLKARGAVITSRWTKPECDHVMPTGLSAQAEDSERQRFALEDVDDVRAANWTVSLMEEPRSNGRGGRHVEFGLAAAFGHRLTIIGPRETVFHHLPNVEHFETEDAFLASLPDALATDEGQG